MKRYRILPYRQGSASAKALATALGGKVLKLQNSKYNYKYDDVLINWGNTSQEAQDMDDGLLPWHNFPNDVKNASNKLNFFRLMKEKYPNDIPEFWTNQADIPIEAYPVVCRTVLAGHSGDGIVIAQSPSDLVAAPLYVKYMKKKDEYRVHVGRRSEDFEIIATQRKARRQDCPNPNWQVRNHANGFNFIRSGFNTPKAVTEAAIAGLRASGLDFGAVDVIWNEEKKRAFVLEINTAPGLEGQTITDYASFFQSMG